MLLVPLSPPQAEFAQQGFIVRKDLHRQSVCHVLRAHTVQRRAWYQKINAWVAPPASTVNILD